MKKNKIFLLLFILGTSFILRFYNLKNRGIFNYDEGYYLMQGQFISSGLKNVLPILKDMKNGYPLQEVYDKYIEGTFLSTPKVLVPPAIAFAGIFTGGIKDYTANYLYALFSLFSVILLWFILSKMYNINIALFGMAIFGSMEYEIIYARCSYPETIPVFLILLSVYVLHVWKTNNFKKTYYWLFSIISSVAIAYNYRSIIPVFIILGLLLFDGIRKKKRLNYFVEIFLMPLVCFFVLAFLFELPYILLKTFGVLPKFTADDAGNKIRIMSYFDMLFSWFGSRSAGMAQNKGFSMYHFTSLWWFVGPLTLALFVIGFFKKVKEQDLINLCVLSLAVAPILIFSFKGFSGRPRALMIALPFIAWISAFGADAILRFLKHLTGGKYEKYLLSVLIIGILLYGNIRSWDILNLESNFNKATQFLNNQGDNKKHFSTIWTVTAYYSGRNNSFYPFPRTVKSFKKECSKENINYVFIDGKYRDQIPDYINEVLNSILPVAKYENKDALHVSNLGRRRNLIMEKIKSNPEINYIFIYKTEDILKQIKL